MRIRYLFYLGIIILLLNSCEFNRETVFRMPAEVLLENYNINSSTEPITRLIQGNIHGLLIEFNNGLYTGDIAENWFAPDTGKYTFLLKDDIRFSDGRYLTPFDVKATYELMTKHPNSRYANSVSLDSIIVRENNYLDIYSSEPLTIIRGFFSNVGILKSEDIEKGDDFISNCATAGVYYISSKSESNITLRKNKYHRDYRKNKNTPDRVELLFQPAIVNGYNMLIQGEVDFIQYLSMNRYKEAYTEGIFHIIEKETNIITYISMNATTPSISTIQPKNANTTQRFDNPLRDRRVRQAIASAIDIRSFLNDLLLQKAHPLIIPALREKFGYPTERECYEYDIELSKRLMNEAGYPDGFAMTIHANEGFLYNQIALFLQDSLKDINIDVTTEIVGVQELISRNPDRAAGIYTMVDYVYIRLATSLRNWYYYDPASPRQNRFGNYNPRINALFDALSHIEDHDIEAIALYKELTDIIYDETFIIPVMNHLDVYLLNKKFVYEEKNDLKFTDFTRVK